MSNAKIIEAPVGRPADVVSEPGLLFCSTSGTTLYKVEHNKRSLDARGNFRLVESRGVVSASIENLTWVLSSNQHTLRSMSTAKEPTYTFSGIDDNNPELFYCVIFKPSTAKAELSLLEQVLDFCTAFHVSERKPNALDGAPFPKLQMPNMDPAMMNEIMRKGAEDTSMMFRVAGDAAQQLFKHAAEMHKKCAPTPAAQPVEVSPALKEKLAHSKMAAKAGATLAKGVTAGVIAATDEVTTALAEVVVVARTDHDNSNAKAGDRGGGEKKKGEEERTKADMVVLGILGKNAVQSLETVRAAMFQAAEVAWGAAKSATGDVFQYQYGQDAGHAAVDAMEVVEGVARVTTSMHQVGLERVAFSAAKKTATAVAASKNKASGAGGNSDRSEGVVVRGDSNKSGTSQSGYPWQQLQDAKSNS